MWEMIKELWFGQPAMMPTYGTAHLPNSAWIKYREYRHSLPPRRVQWYGVRAWKDAKPIVLREMRTLNDLFVWTRDYSGDDWRLPKIGDDGKLRADCDGYAAFLKERLILAGLDVRVPRLALCHSDGNARGYNHMALILAFSDGDRVIDNIHAGSVWDWRGMPYRWVAREDIYGGFESLERSYEP